MLGYGVEISEGNLEDVRIRYRNIIHIYNYPYKKIDLIT